MDEVAALKKLLLQRLRESTAVAALVSNRIHDVPPVSAFEMTTPYIRFGPFSSADDGAECFESSDITGQIDVYSNGPGEAASTAEALKISGLIRSILNSFPEDVDLGDGYILSDIRFRNKRVITANDGKTKHVPITFSAIVDKT